MSPVTKKKDETLDTVETVKEYTSIFICLIHCEGGGSQEKGVCPVCGMDYVRNEDNNSKVEIHVHDSNHNHQGHNFDPDNESQ